MALSKAIPKQEPVPTPVDLNSHPIGASGWNYMYDDCQGRSSYKQTATSHYHSEPTALRLSVCCVARALLGLGFLCRTEPGLAFVFCLL